MQSVYNLVSVSYVLSKTQVVPPILLLSATAESMYFGLQCHPSFRTIHGLTNQIMSLSKIPALQLHEIDGAYANERLNVFFLTMSGFDASSGGFCLEQSRCQSHATHLITVSMMSMLGCNLFSKLYQLTVFLSNLGYVLRLQMALRDWILENMVWNPCCDLQALQPDPLMAEIRDYIETWHHSQTRSDDGDDDENQQHANTKFASKMSAFVDMWNGSGTGRPTHNCNCHMVDGHDKHCRDRNHAAEKMASVLISLLLTSCPSPPAPNKWTKLWRPVDFVSIGIFLNNFLPQIFDIAFKAMGFTTQHPGTQEEADPRIIEKLQFHEVQGKRYLGSKTFLQDRTSQFAMRLLLVGLEHLRYLTNSWLGNLNALKTGGRYPLFTLFDSGASPVVASLKRIAGLLTESRSGRLIFLWGTAADSYESWCQMHSDEIRLTRRVLLTLSALIHRRHVLHWLKFPWPLAALADPNADQQFVAETCDRWDAAGICCVRPGLARNLKALRIASSEFRTDSILGLISFGMGLNGQYNFIHIIDDQATQII